MIVSRIQMISEMVRFVQDDRISILPPRSDSHLVLTQQGGYSASSDDSEKKLVNFGYDC
jgi:hypothetical protein